MGKGSDSVPLPAVRRLSLYLRQLEILQRDEKRTISSKQLGEVLGLTDAQVRKDLAYFGQFGHPGIGYRVEELIRRCRSILGTDRTWNVLVAGAGNLGRALCAYKGFESKGFRIRALFDNDPAKIGMVLPQTGRLVVRAMDDMPAVVAELDIRIGVIAVPADVAQSVAEQVLAAGVGGVLNFAPTCLRLPTAAMADVDLAVHLEQLAFQISAQNM